MVSRLVPGAGDDQQPGMSVEELCQCFRQHDFPVPDALSRAATDQISGQ